MEVSQSIQEFISIAICSPISHWDPVDSSDCIRFFTSKCHFRESPVGGPVPVVALVSGILRFESMRKQSTSTHRSPLLSESLYTTTRHTHTKPTPTTRI